MAGSRPSARTASRARPFGVAPEQDVDAAAGHVGGHRDGIEATGLGDDSRLPGVLLGVEDLVGDASFGEHARQHLGLLHRRRADQDGLALFVALDHVVDHGVELGLLGAVDEVRVVLADHGQVGRDGHDLDVVGRAELGGLRHGRARHARQLFVEAEVILQGDRGPGVVLLLDRDPLLGLDGLMEAVRPAPALQDAPGELVHDLDFPVRHQVFLVPLVQLLGLEGLGQLVDQVGRAQVVEVVYAEQALDLLDAVLGGGDRALFLVHLVVRSSWTRLRATPGELVVEAGGLVGRAGDDERGPGLVDQDGVHLVDDGEVVASLDHVVQAAGHVVAQVVEAELGVGPVGDVAVVGLLLVVPVREVGGDPPHRETEEPVDRAHPLGVAAGQVIVDRDHVDALLVQGVEVHGQGRHQGLAFTRLHLGDPPEVQAGTAHELDVVVTLADGPLGRLAYHGKRLGQELVEVLAVGDAAP